MFVECFSGLMGGGKSFYSVIRFAEHISKGGVVFSNINLKLDPWFNESYADKMKSFWLPECLEGCRVELHKGGIILPVMRRNSDGAPEFEYNSKGFKWYLEKTYKWRLQDGQYNYLPDSVIGPGLPEHLPKGSQRRPVLVALDEALEHFESNIKGGSATSEFRSFLRHIRKLGINLVFIAQDFGSMEKKVRELTHYVWRFRDMYTWDVPVFNRPLPPPWRDHVVCEKFHRGQFGKTKSEPVNKHTWVFRDPMVFGSYQSIAMHNDSIKMADDMRIDFGDSGRIVKERKKMNKFERIGLAACLVFSLVAAFRRPAVRVGQVESAIGGSGVAASDPVKVADEAKEAVKEYNVPTVTVEYKMFQYLHVNGRIRGMRLDGVPIKVGQMTEHGVIQFVSTDSVQIVDIKGNATYIYPLGRGMPDTVAATRPESVSNGTATSFGSQET